MSRFGIRTTISIARGVVRYRLDCYHSPTMQKSQHPSARESLMGILIFPTHVTSNNRVGSGGQSDNLELEIYPVMVSIAYNGAFVANTPAPRSVDILSPPGTIEPVHPLCQLTKVTVSGDSVNRVQGNRRSTTGKTNHRIEDRLICREKA